MERRGLVDVIHGVVPKTVRATLTETGRQAVLMEGWENPADEARRLVADLVRSHRRTVHGDTPDPAPWPVEVGPEPGWYSGRAIVADPVLAARYGLAERMPVSAALTERVRNANVGGLEPAHRPPNLQSRPGHGG